MSGISVEGLTPNQEKTVLALLSEPSVAKAAEIVGVSPRTVYRWLEEPEFSRQFRRLRRESFAQAIGFAQRYAPMAIGTLAKLMSDPSTPHASRVSAAAVLLKFSRDSIELDELVGRMQALEVAAGIIDSDIEFTGMIQTLTKDERRAADAADEAEKPNENGHQKSAAEAPSDGQGGGF
ncbi:MAG: helix-turn-helix domain-containing protein [Planctomycetes bacterium]|nr:helix-turn-helix domain-containing protein [Planctomycetota bacterium]